MAEKRSADSPVPHSKPTEVKRADAIACVQSLLSSLESYLEKRVAGETTPAPLVSDVPDAESLRGRVDSMIEELEESYARLPSSKPSPSPSAVRKEARTTKLRAAPASCSYFAPKLGFSSTPAAAAVVVDKGPAVKPFDVLLCYDGVNAAFLCPFSCSTISATPLRLRTHAEQEHGVRFNRVCGSCGAGFASVDNFDVHARVCDRAAAGTVTEAAMAPPPPALRNEGRSFPAGGHDDWFLCGVCGDVYFDRARLADHVAELHPTTCPVCQGVVADAPDVWQHFARAHPALLDGTDVGSAVLAINSSPPYCNVCLADCLTWAGVEAHLSTCSREEVGRRRVEAASSGSGCRLCGLPVHDAESESGGGGVRAHFAARHSRSCHVCYARFWQESEFAAHMFRHSEWLNSAFCGPAGFWRAQEDGVRPFCHLCPGTGEAAGAGARARARFGSWPEVERHYRTEHAPKLTPPMNQEDYYYFGVGGGESRASS